MNKFKVGDLIERIRPGDRVNHVTEGHHYKVEQVEGEGVFVLNDYGILDKFDADNFRLVANEEELASAPFFQAGDVVRRVSGPVSGNVTIGKEYAVIRVSPEGRTIWHLDDNLRETSRNARHYVLVREANKTSPEPAFKSSPKLTPEAKIKGWGAWA